MIQGAFWSEESAISGSVLSFQFLFDVYFIFCHVELLFSVYLHYELSIFSYELSIFS